MDDFLDDDLESGLRRLLRKQSPRMLLSLPFEVLQVQQLLQFLFLLALSLLEVLLFQFLFQYLGLSESVLLLLLLDLLEPLCLSELLLFGEQDEA